MKRLKTYLIVLLGVLILASCSTTQTRNSFGTVTDIEIEPGIYDAIEATRLNMIGSQRINDLSSEQKEKLVLAKYSATSSNEESVLSVSFEDYMTGKTVASCRSSNSAGWTRQRDVDRAIRKLAKRIQKVWGK